MEPQHDRQDFDAETLAGVAVPAKIWQAAGNGPKRAQQGHRTSTLVWPRPGAGPAKLLQRCPGELPQLPKLHRISTTQNACIKTRALQYYVSTCSQPAMENLADDVSSFEKGNGSRTGCLAAATASETNSSCRRLARELTWVRCRSAGSDASTVGTASRASDSSQLRSGVL